MPLVTCPAPADLAQLYLGGMREDEIAALEAHVQECPSCLEKLQGLLAENETLAEALAVWDTLASEAARPRVVELIRKMERLQHPGRPAPTAVVAAGSPTSPSADQPDATLGVPPGSEDAIRLTDFLAPPLAPDELGRLGEYRILKVLDHGGMGVVFQAEDPALKRAVALKVMLPALAASASAAKRFRREAEAMAAVEHDHIVRIYRIAEERGVPFLAMEFLKGESLDERLQRAEPLTLAEVLRIGREIAEGVAAAHATDLIHRDIKPGNIWLEAPRQRVKILDFGLARADAAQDAGLTQQGAIIGTPAYMAPEQGAGSAVDARCDLFSLGVVLYRMSTGQQPFQGTNSVATLMAVAMHEPETPARINAALPHALSELVMQLLEKDPERRPKTAAAVVHALQAIEQKLGEGKPAPAAVTPPGNRLPRRRSRVRLTVALLVLFGLVALGGGLFYWQTDHGTVRIEIDDPEIQVSFYNKTLTFQGVHDQHNLRVSTGAHGLHVQRGSLQFDTDKPIVVRRGDTITLKVEWLKQGKLQVTQGDKVIGAKGLPTRASPLLQTFRGHTDRIRSVALSGDGKRVATGSSDMTAILWEAASGKKLQDFQGHTGHLWSVALDRDSKYLLTGSADKTAILWETSSGKVLRTFAGHTDVVTAVAISGDGKQVVTASSDMTAILWEAASGNKIQTFRNQHTSWIYAVALSSDGKHVVTGSYDATAILWESASGKALQTYRGHQDQIMSVALSRDGQHVLTGSWDKLAIWWEAGSGKQLKIFRGHTNALWGVALSSDGKHALTGSEDRTAILWDTADGKKLQTFRGHTRPVMSVALSADGKLALTGSEDHTAILWEVQAALPPKSPD